MVSMMQMEAVRRLESDGFHPVQLPHGLDTPIPGLILFADVKHRKLLMVQGDGSTVDLLVVYRLALDCVRNWQKGSSLPGFVGDFKRLTPLAEALNGTAMTSTHQGAPTRQK